MHAGIDKNSNNHAQTSVCMLTFMHDSHFSSSNIGVIYNNNKAHTCMIACRQNPRHCHKIQGNC